MEILLILGAILLFYWLKTGFKGRKLYNQLKTELTSKYGWSSGNFHYVWNEYNKQIVNWQIDGLSPEEIAKKIHENYNDVERY